MKKIRTLESVRAEILGKRDRGLKWRVIADDYQQGGYRIPLGTLCRIAKDDHYQPRNHATLKALGLPVTAPAPVCPRCGVVHLRKCRARNMPAWVSQAADWLAEREKASIP